MNFQNQLQCRFNLLLLLNFLTNKNICQGIFGDKMLDGKVNNNVASIVNPRDATPERNKHKVEY